MSSEMREFSKVKEKIEVRLDTHEIAWLVVGCMLTAAGIFSAGYFVGSKAQITPQRELAVTGLQATDNAESDGDVDVAMVDPQYTYDRQLTTKTPPEKLDDPWLAVLSKSKDKMKESSVGKVDSDSDIDGPDLALAGPRPVGAANVVPAVQQPSAPLPGTINAWPQAVSAQQPAPGTKAGSPPNSVADASGFTIQIKAFPKQNDAGSFAKALRDAGYKPYVVAANIPAKGKYYRVRLGKFDTLADAVAKQSLFEDAEGYSTIVTPL